MDRKSSASFWNGLRWAFGALGGAWYPSNATEGAGPFNSIGSDAGPSVNAASALQLAAAWACVRLISETIGSLPLSLYHANARGRLEVARDSVTHRMLRYAPNSEMTAVDFWGMCGASLCLWGNFYAQLIRVGGRVVQMIPLRPEFMTVFRTKAGDIRYRYQQGAKGQEFAAEDILHIRGFGVDGLIGLSPVGVARQTIGRSIATDQASSGVFKTGLSVSGFILHDKAFPDKEQREDVRAQIAKFTGSAQVGGVMVLENGMKYEPMSMDPKDAQMLESRQFNVEEICRIYGVPPQLIGHLTKSSSWASSLENTVLGFQKFCLIPYLVRIEQALRRALKIPADSALKYNFDALLRGDSAARAALWASGLQNGYVTRNEVRDDEDRDHIDIPNGDELTIQANMVLLRNAGQNTATSTSPEPNPAVDPTP